MSYSQSAKQVSAKNEKDLLAEHIAKKENVLLPRGFLLFSLLVTSFPAATELKHVHTLFDKILSFFLSFHSFSNYIQP